MALITQEHESIVAFLNQGGGQFRKTTLFAAPHPAFGSSGPRMVDFDRDGDLDAVLSNGEVYDFPLLKPYRGVSWLENRGLDRPFVRHQIGAIYRAHRALDGDGKLDIVAGRFRDVHFAGAAPKSSGDANAPFVIWK